MISDPFLLEKRYISVYWFLISTLLISLINPRNATHILNILHRCLYHSSIITIFPISNPYTFSPALCASQSKSRKWSGFRGFQRVFPHPQENNVSSLSKMSLENFSVFAEILLIGFNEIIFPLVCCKLFFKIINRFEFYHVSIEIIEWLSILIPMLWVTASHVLMSKCQTMLIYLGKNVGIIYLFFWENKSVVYRLLPLCLWVRINFLFLSCMYILVRIW